ncbi:acetyltransferase [Oceanobacillus halophilus]|uniref:Acetyltransferase n=1 Tax=Oceanobacillus halophilus TaxID=930130 RepID=A0A495A3G9_9BACI|nr:acetyltransferase [Oceanobacillus halophilus]RKQ33498.1 acetyltransferase [Oceanobacillus halophilus]
MKIILVGNGGHSKVIQDIIASIRNSKVVAILDDKYEMQFEEGGILYGPLSLINSILVEKDFRVMVAIGDNAIRKKVIKSLNLQMKQYAIIIHPTAVISPTATIGYGTVVMPKAVINAETSIGSHCIVNTSSIVEHENKIADYVHISPNATSTGNVTIGEGGHLGASSVIIPGITVGNWSVIGAGSTVINNVPAYSKAVGSPSRIIDKIKL